MRIDDLREDDVTDPVPATRVVADQGECGEIDRLEAEAPRVAYQERSQGAGAAPRRCREGGLVEHSHGAAFPIEAQGPGAGVLWQPLLGSDPGRDCRAAFALGTV